MLLEGEANLKDEDKMFNKNRINCDV